MLALDEVENLQAVEAAPLQPDVEENEMRPPRLDGGQGLVGLLRRVEGTATRQGRLGGERVVGLDVDRGRAGADNRRLWNAVYGAVADPTNALPPALRAQIAGVALAVIRECDAAEPDLAFIAEVNDRFAAALWR